MLFTAAVGMASYASAQVRYVDDVFVESEIQVTSDVTYGINWNEFAPASIGGPQLLPLMCDIYEPDPSVDTETDRPVIVYFHTGSFLPKGLVSPMGEKTDSAAVEFCTRFAKKGFVAISATYRVGWLANSTNLDLRRGTNLLAVYKSIQDAKSLVRWLRFEEANSSDPYGVDGNHVVLLGQGSGGYATFAYATLDAYGEVANPTKFQYDVAGTGINGQAVNAGDPYIDTAQIGDWDGYGGAVTLTGNTTPLGLPEVDETAYGRNFINWPGINDDVSLVLNLGGALGDSTWLEAGETPMASVHSQYDFFAPYYSGMVQVPVGQQFFPVVEVAGSHTAVRKANAFGNNDDMNNANFMDPISVIARNRAANLGMEENIFTVSIAPPNAALPFQVNSNPWDFWDPSDPLGANETNPNIKAQSMAYIDTCMLFFIPRIKEVLNANGANIGLDESLVEAKSFDVYPNPAKDVVHFNFSNNNIKYQSITITDVNGKLVYAKDYAKEGPLTLDVSAFNSGAYFIELKTNEGTYGQRLIKK